MRNDLELMSYSVDEREASYRVGVTHPRYEIKCLQPRMQTRVSFRGDE